MAMEAWAVAMEVWAMAMVALAVATVPTMVLATVDLAVAMDAVLALATTIKDAIEDSHLLPVDFKIHQFCTPHILRHLAG